MYHSRSSSIFQDSLGNCLFCRWVLLRNRIQQTFHLTTRVVIIALWSMMCYLMIYQHHTRLATILLNVALWQHFHNPDRPQMQEALENGIGITDAVNHKFLKRGVCIAPTTNSFKKSGPWRGLHQRLLSKHSSLPLTNPTPLQYDPNLKRSKLVAVDRSLSCTKLFSRFVKQAGWCCLYRWLSMWMVLQLRPLLRSYTIGVSNTQVAT